MKKLILMLLSCLMAGVTVAQFVQTDWSGGGGQTVFIDPTKFDVAWHTDYTSIPGDISAQNENKYHVYGVTDYNGKLMVSTSWHGTFIYDPVAGTWEFSHIAPLISYKNNTIHSDGKLYVMNYPNIYSYDGTLNDYGMGSNGWHLHSNLENLGLNAVYTLHSAQGRLLIGCRGWAGGQTYTARVIEYHEASQTWNQMGNTFTNGVCSLMEYNGTIYAGTHWAGYVYKWNGSSWVVAFDTPSMSIVDLEVHDGYLYAAGAWDNSRGRLYKYDGNTNQQVHYFSGARLYDLESHGDVLAFTYGYTNPVNEVMQYDGTSVSTLYAYNGEKSSQQLCSFEGDLYYGGCWGAYRSMIYKNGADFESIYVKGVLSSEFSTVNGLLNIDASCMDGNGVKVFVQGKNNPTYNASPWIEVTDGSAVSVAESTMRYWAILYTIGEGGGPTLHEISIGAQAPTDPLVLAIVGQSDVSCFGGNDGFVEVEASGGTPPYTYNLNGLNTSNSSTLTAGTYNISITDAVGEQSELTAIISEPTLLEGTLTTTNISCNGGDDGTIDLTVIGGTAPYSYLWSNGSTSEDLSGLTAGAYSVLVTDANACILGNSTTLEEPDPVNAYAGEDALVYYGYDPMASTQLQASGGIYYSWSPTTGLNDPTVANPIASPTETTTYTVTVTDQDGCANTDVVTVEVIDVRCGKNLNKVLICHDGHTICVSSNAVAAHLNHGDYLGDCTGQKTGSITSNAEQGIEVIAFPNPFQDKCQIELVSPTSSHVAIRVYDMQGKIQTTIFEGNLKTGTYTFDWENRLSERNTIYLLKVISNSEVKTIKLLKN